MWNMRKVIDYLLVPTPRRSMNSFSFDWTFIKLKLKETDVFCLKSTDVDLFTTRFTSSLQESSAQVPSQTIHSSTQCKTLCNLLLSSEMLLKACVFGNELEESMQLLWSITWSADFLFQDDQQMIMKPLRKCAV